MKLVLITSGMCSLSWKWILVNSNFDLMWVFFEVPELDLKARTEESWSSDSVNAAIILFSILLYSRRLVQTSCKIFNIPCELAFENYSSLWVVFRKLSASPLSCLLSCTALLDKIVFWNFRKKNHAPEISFCLPQEWSYYSRTCITVSFMLLLVRPV